MQGNRCRGPAPGKSRRNDSLVIFPATASPFGVNVHLHNAAGDTETALNVKRDLAARLGGEMRSTGHTARYAGRGRRYVSPVERDALAEANRAARATQEAGAEAKRRKGLARCKRIWAETVPMGEPLQRYLLGTRGLCDLGLGAELADALRFHPDLDYWELGDNGKPVRLFSSPAMVAGVVNAEGLKAGLHVTYLSENGHKHPLAKPARKMMGETGGGCVRLGPLAPDGRHAVAEGIETALAFWALWGVPCDAALSADALARYTPRPGCTALVIAADNDANTAEATRTNPGLDAAAKLAARMAALKLPTRTLAPTTNGDWADVITGKAR